MNLSSIIIPFKLPIHYFLLFWKVWTTAPLTSGDKCYCIRIVCNSWNIICFFVIIYIVYLNNYLWLHNIVLKIDGLSIAKKRSLFAMIFTNLIALICLLTNKRPHNYVKRLKFKNINFFFFFCYRPWVCHEITIITEK